MNAEDIYFVEDTEEIQWEKNTWDYWTISLRYGSKHEMKFCKARNNNNQEVRNQVSHKQRYVKFLSHTACRLQNKRIKYSFFPLWVRGRWSNKERWCCWRMAYLRAHTENKKNTTRMPYNWDSSVELRCGRLILLSLFLFASPYQEFHQLRKASSWRFEAH